MLPYAGTLRTLFDDSIDPEVFSAPAESTFDTADGRFRDRIRNSAFVVTVVVVTVTDESTAQTGRLELELAPVEHPIHGALSPFVQPGEPIRVRLGSSSASSGLVRSFQTELVGRRMNLCWGRFVDGAETVEHWHAFSDTPRTKAALVKSASIVDFN